MIKKILHQPTVIIHYIYNDIEITGKKLNELRSKFPDKGEIARAEQIAAAKALNSGKDTCLYVYPNPKAIEIKFCRK